MKKLYKYHLDCGGMGDVEGMFIIDEDILKQNFGKCIYFGEILGKH